jgi:hypothetical protein
MPEDQPFHESQPIMSFHPNLELRQVPLAWEHPTDERGQYVPLLSRRAFEELEGATYSDEDLAVMHAEGFDPLNPEAASMPDFSEVPPEEMGWRVYHTVNEGEPATPAFPDTPEGREALIAHTAENVVKLGRPVGRIVAEALFTPRPSAQEILDGVMRSRSGDSDAKN